MELDVSVYKRYDGGSKGKGLPTAEGVTTVSGKKSAHLIEKLVLLVGEPEGYLFREAQKVFQVEQILVVALVL